MSRLRAHAVLGLCLGLAACTARPEPDPRFIATATLGGVPVADVTLQVTAEGRLSLTRTREGRLTTEQVTLNDEGRLRIWEQTTPEMRTWVLFLDGTATWRRSSPDGDSAGSLPLAPAPWWTPALHLALPTALGEGWIWSDGRALPARLKEAPAGRRADTPAGPIEHLGAAGELAGWRDPWGEVTALRPTTRPLPPLVYAPAMPEARRLRRLVARWPDGTQHIQTRPLRAEIPPNPSAAPLPQPPYPTLPPTLPQVEPIVPGSTRLQTLERALSASRERLRPGPGAPAPFVQPALARGSGDCDERALLLAALLAQQGIEARVITGWLITESLPERHAWVRVAWGDDMPSLDVDPSQPGLVADAGRVPDPPWGPPPPGAQLEILEAIGPEGPVSWRAPAHAE